MSMYEDTMDDIRLTRSSKAYQQAVWNDTRANPEFEAGMLVNVNWRTGTYLGRVIKHMGFNEFWLMHKYEIEFACNSIIECVFETDMERVCGFKPRIAS